MQLSECKQVTLRQYQSDLIRDTRKAISEHGRVIVQSHVGSGKTIVASEIIRLAIDRGKSVLFLAPRRQLIYQTVEALADFGIFPGIIMAGEKRSYGNSVQVASFDTITSRVGSGRMILPDADLCIVDECHMCVSPSRIKVLENYKMVIGLTATPVLANGKGMGSFYNSIVESLSMAEMVDCGYLVPMRYYIGEVPDMSSAKLNKDGDYTDKFLGEVNDQPKLIGRIYENWVRIASDRTTLIFAVNKKHARHLHDEFESHGVRVDYIDGETPPEDREKIRSDVMEGRTQVIVNIGVMVAGVNWPRIDCIVMARQTKNIATWIQCLGRGSRLYQGKSDCIVIYHGSNFSELGMIADPLEWSLDDKTTLKERKQEQQKEVKQPKEIICGDCGTVFKSRKNCPICGCEMIKSTESIPCYESELTEVKVSPADKKRWYAQLLYYAQSKGFKRGFADHLFRQKFGHWPSKKNGIIPEIPSEDVINYIRPLNIRKDKSAA